MPRLQIITALRSLTIEAAQQHKMRGQQLNRGLQEENSKDSQPDHKFLRVKKKSALKIF